MYTANPLPTRDVDAAADDDQQQYLTFRVGEETYAVGILMVKEILEYGGVTVVPGMPADVRGVINLRGDVVPVIDLAVKLERGAIVPGRRTCIVIVELADVDGRHDVGVIVDTVNKVVEIPPEDVGPPPALGGRVRSNVLAGVGRLDGQLVMLLDLERVLSGDEIEAMGTVA